MSGVYIPGMKMPNRGHTVTLTITGSGVAVVQYYDCKPQLAVPIVSKAVPVPDHGDLIDRDAARESIKPWSPEDERTGCTFDTVKKLMHTMLDRAPTVIPADKEAET